jgi:hypothetical protein
MNIKDIIVGNYYKLSSKRASRTGCSLPFFKEFYNQEVLVLKKLNNFGSKNTVQVQGILSEKDNHKLVSFWCSNHDLQDKG